jgi:hypothetical protein
MIAKFLIVLLGACFGALAWGSARHRDLIVFALALLGLSAASVGLFVLL